MAFEVYKPRGEKAEKAPLVSLSKNSIVLNKLSREKLQTENVELAFDTDTRTIRIKAVAEGQAIKKTKLFARGFFNHFGITTKGKFPAVFNNEENALYVKIE
ncbi:MAG TPA: hypothetical protein DCZ10_02720 [Pelotomaculum sp.]|jgi:hypothetical protein|nr:hypothetical protein [Pelotomaculum sp.]